MDEKLYELMDWAEIEAVVYSEEDKPQDILGAHVTEQGILIQCFFPGAVSVQVKMERTGKLHKMEMQDEAGFFAVLIKGKRILPYHYVVTYETGEEISRSDVYTFPDCITKNEIEKFENGINYTIYEKLGAHPMKLNGVDGVLFAVWAPNAIRVSVVGDFNKWDGRIYQMKRLYDSGVFELFIPGVKKGMIYKYEIKTRGGLPILKADPYEYYSEFRPANASVVWDLETYKWGDESWLEKRKKSDIKKEPMSIYEVHLGSWKKPEDYIGDEDNAFYSYRELAPMLASYVKKMNYTHIELMPVMEHPFDGSWGYQVTGYYAATSRYGTPDDFMYFIDYMHKKGIGVILDWVPAHFPRDAFALANFDGTCLYEHEDPRQGSHPHWGTLIFNYGRPEVANFLIANALFWVEKYHADGIRMDAVASMLYLDYGKEDGEWIPNIYGGKENLEAIEVLKHLNSVFKKRQDGAIIIAEESTAWPMVTGEVEEGSLGFDLKWNMGWMNDILRYMKLDPLFRSGNQNLITFSMMYAYSENFLLVLSHDEVVHGKASLIGKMPGDIELKFANLRALYGFMMTHPGKKLLFMGQEFAQFSEWSEKKGLDWFLLDEYESHRKMQKYVSALNRLYQDYSALYELDYEPDGFEWIDCSDSEQSIVTFLRKTNKKEETLLVICNFTPVVREDYRVGVPFKGKYKETFNSDRVEFGGQGHYNPRLKYSKAIPYHGRKESIAVTVPPLGITVFTCTPVEEKKTEKKKAGKTKSAANKITGKRNTKSKQTEKGSESKEKPVERLETKVKKVEQIESKKKPVERLETKAKKAEQIESKKKPVERLETKAKKAEQIESKEKPVERLETKAKKAEQIESKEKPVERLETKAKKAEQIESKEKPEKKVKTRKATEKKNKEETSSKKEPTKRTKTKKAEQ
ncbi:1,4-alpha-glucan branching protein GlgB [Velocimicrobium porci]|uniref:1,4-alpha-glucan branching enzyme GlgB n=1 Tax=Velocimicrobium porci TaxID=2606634 RepID=A0A6L5XWB8_9FIRM|nr:1,4-alpha-glucan branching protein GlgB [Velocimicrobium porci]MSS62343.1 1,4-alpha-glucan branching protein GlgB [Velocimicrobium porci]